LEKLACGRFSDNARLAAGKRRGFCRLRRAIHAGAGTAARRGARS
jgi:hypothetical protein